MSQLPKYPYRVVVTRRLGFDLASETHNYENLAGAYAFRDIALSKPMTRKVQILLVIDEATPSHDLPVHIHRVVPTNDRGK